MIDMKLYKISNSNLLSFHPTPINKKYIYFNDSARLKKDGKCSLRFTKVLNFDSNCGEMVI